MHRLAQLYLATRRAHPIWWECIDLGAGAVVVALMRSTWGRTAAVAAAIFWAVLTLLGFVTLRARVRRARGESSQSAS